MKKLPKNTFEINEQRVTVSLQGFDIHFSLSQLDTKYQTPFICQNFEQLKYFLRQQTAQRYKSNVEFFLPNQSKLKPLALSLEIVNRNDIIFSINTPDSPSDQIRLLLLSKDKFVKRYHYENDLFKAEISWLQLLKQLIPKQLKAKTKAK